MKEKATSKKNWPINCSRVILSTSQKTSCMHAMIVQDIVSKRNFMEAPYIGNYGQLQKISCGNKK